MACVQSQKSSLQYQHDAPVQRRIASIDYHFTSHICGFCVTSLGLRYGSRSAHQASHQSFSTGTSSATKNHTQVGPSSLTFGIDESVVRLGGQWSGRNLRWCHSNKMADYENSVPVSFGFGEMKFISSCFECHSRQVCVFERKHPASTDGISVTRSRVSCQKPATVAGSAMDLRAGYCTSQPIWIGTDALPCQAIVRQSCIYGIRSESGGRQQFSFIRSAPS